MSKIYLIVSVLFIVSCQNDIKHESDLQSFEMWFAQNVNVVILPGNDFYNSQGNSDMKITVSNDSTQFTFVSRFLIIDSLQVMNSIVPFVGSQIRNKTYGNSSYTIVFENNKLPNILKLKAYYTYHSSLF